MFYIKVSCLFTRGEYEPYYLSKYEAIPFPIEVRFIYLIRLTSALV